MKPGWNKVFKKLVLLALAVCLIVPQTAWAEGEETVPIWQFQDMAESHWATKHVRKIGLLGITSGDDKGRYNPTQNITREQAVIMAINLLGLQEEAKANTVQVNLGFSVSAWAEPYVKYAVVKGIIDLRDEAGNVTSAGAWGTVSASREWIAKLVAKALGKDADAADLDGAYTGFVDDAAISDGYSGYVNVVKNLGIIVGDNNNRFNPTSPITRAEMAVVFGKAEQLLTTRNAHVVTGTFESGNQTSITLRTSAGTVVYPLADDAVFYAHDSNSPILPSNLTLGDAIFLIQYGGKAYYIEKTVQTVRYETIVGEFVNIYTDTSAGQTTRIAIIVDGETRTYPFSASVTSFTRENGTGISTSEITPGSVLELRRVAGTEQITSVVVKKAVDRKTISGTVERIFADQRLIEIKDPATGERQPLYTVTADAAVWSGSRQITLADLHVGDEVSLYLVDGSVQEIVVVKSAVTTVEGKVQKVDASLRVIHLYGTPIVGYEAESNAVISISGLNAPKLSDIQTDDEVVLELNEKQRITKVTVLNRSIDARMGVAFVMFHEDSNTLIYEDHEKNLERKVLSANTAIVNQYGSQIDLNQINQHFREGDKIDLVITGDRIVRMGYSKTYTGVLKQISAQTNTIVMDADEFGEVSFTYTNAPAVALFGKPNATMSDLLIGNRIKLELDPTQKRVMFIAIEFQQLFKVKEKLSYKMVVTDSAGKSHDITNLTAVSFTHYDKLYATYADVTAGEYVMVTFSGNSATNVYVPRLSYGIVQNVDLVNNTFTFTEYGKTARVVTDNRLLDIGGTSYYSVSPLKSGDRIMLVEGDNGIRFVTPLVKQQRKVFRYIANTQTVQFTAVNLNEQNMFKVDASVYVHQQGTPIAASTLKKDDVVDVYFHESRLFEIEKR
jgi:hypothetical protein